MIDFIIAVAVATIAWFLVAGALFFNPIVDKIYRSEEDHPAVRNLPQNPGTIARILGAVLVQCVLWAGLYLFIKTGLGDTLVSRGLAFTAIISLVKIVPRDIDRMLLTTYPPKRLGIEIIAGFVCAAVVGFVFAWLL